jgi:NADH-quinone oxidoreductase subunit E
MSVQEYIVPSGTAHARARGMPVSKQKDDFVLSQAERDAIAHETHHYEDPRAASIEALKIVQQARGWVPDGAIHAIAAELGIPASDVEGVATFYSQIFRQPVGRHIIRVCDSMVCYINGHEQLLAGLKEVMDLAPGQTSPTAASPCCRSAASATATRGRR